MLFENVLVTRTLGMDFIYFDLIFITIWFGLLIYKKYWQPIGWGLFGWIVYIFVDYVAWGLIMKTRTYSGPLPEFLFFMWFCFSPGFVQFSYIILMFEKRNWKEVVFWTILFYTGWSLVGGLSRLINLDDRTILVARNMSEAAQRIVMTAMAIGNLILGIVLVLKKKIRWQDLVYLFAAGTLVEGALEFSLAVSGIRQLQGTWSLEMAVVNTLIEFNLGTILMYLLFLICINKRDKGIWPPLGWADRGHIKTDFNFIAALVHNKLEHNPKRIEDLKKVFGTEDLKNDVNYYIKKYKPETDLAEILSLID